uniref:Maturase K n=1 Tax=Romanomermis culicivorax TaxID=13658 RepID=A0A915IXS7_ROMCU
YSKSSYHYCLLELFNEKASFTVFRFELNLKKERFLRDGRQEAISPILKKRAPHLAHTPNI